MHNLHGLMVVDDMPLVFLLNFRVRSVVLMQNPDAIVIRQEKQSTTFVLSDIGHIPKLSDHLRVQRIREVKDSNRLNRVTCWNGMWSIRRESCCSRHGQERAEALTGVRDLRNDMGLRRICDVDQCNAMPGAVLDIKIILIVVRGRKETCDRPVGKRNVRCDLDLILIWFRWRLLGVLLSRKL